MAFDHLVVAARTLDGGSRWIERELIQWLGPHPAAALPPSGCDLVHLRRGGHAVLRTPAGERMLPWRMAE